MKKSAEFLIAGALLIFIFKGVLMSSFVPPAASSQILRYGSCASSTQSLKFYDTSFVPSTAQGDSITFSGCGFTTIPNVQCSASLNTTNAGASPQISIKSISTTGVSFNITNGNTSVVTLLSTVVSLGAASSFATANLPNITIQFSAVGY